MLTLSPGDVSLSQLEQIWREQPPVKLDTAAHERIATSAVRVEQAAKGPDAIYGVNTGFGKLASIRIDRLTLKTNV